ncbi:MAG TPA: adenylate/guanylate cyclase domain-containing protein, partial [Actinomycetota bacterium]
MSDAGAMREERRFVTALFADLVGSTALAERLEPEEFKLVVGDAITRIVGAVESFGGTVKDLAGDGVLALFGAPVAHEDDPERALLAALRITDEIEDFADEVQRSWGIEDFGVRVGVESGPVVVGAVGAGSRVEYGAMGDALNVAARLQSHADPGTVLVGEGTAERVEPLFEWGPQRTLDLKGKADGVGARTVLAHTAAPARTRGLEGIQTPVVGRERELGEIRALAEAAIAGTGAILVVSGEPG